MTEIKISLGIVFFAAMLAVDACAGPYASATPGRHETPQTLEVKRDNAVIIGEIETARAQAEAEIHRINESNRIAVETLRQENAIATDAKAQAVYPAKEIIWAIVTAALACIVYCYKRLSFAGAFLGLLCFASLFSYILMGQHYPELAMAAPLPFIVFILYVAHKNGIVASALRTCVKSIEVLDAKPVKEMIAAADGENAVERAGRKYMDEAANKKK